jgi:uncharacterized protein YbaP (TraB family)
MLLCLFFVSMPLLAQDVPLANSQTAADPEIRDMDAVVVTGVQPGPGMWKVSKGDHVLWIMGTLTPLPKGMTWLSRDVETVLGQAQEVIDSPSVTFDSDVGMFRSMLMIPSVLKLRKNPDGRTLSEVLPPPMYARWKVLKAKYLGHDGGVEEWRPMFAANELYAAAIKKSGLSTEGVVLPVVHKLAKKGGIKRTPVQIKFTVENPKEAIKEFRTSELADIGCFDKTLTRLESDLPIMTARANAWSIGDMEALRVLSYEDQGRACQNAFMDNAVAKKLGMGDIPARTQALWLEKAEAALAANRVSFATLPVSHLLSGKGYLAQLQAKGYAVEEP